MVVDFDEFTPFLIPPHDTNVNGVVSVVGREREPRLDRGSVRARRRYYPIPAEERSNPDELSRQASPVFVGLLRCFSALSRVNSVDLTSNRIRSNHALSRSLLTRSLLQGIQARYPLSYRVGTTALTPILTQQPREISNSRDPECSTSSAEPSGEHHRHALLITTTDGHSHAGTPGINGKISPNSRRNASTSTRSSTCVLQRLNGYRILSHGA